MKIIINGHKDSLNNGNMLMALGLFEGLRKKNINASIILLSDVPEIDRERYKDLPVLNIIDRPWSRQKKGALQAILTAFFFGLWVLTGRIIEFLSGHKVKFPWNPLCHAYDTADLAVDISGDDLTTAYGWLAPLQVLYELFLAKLFGLKTTLLAHSMGPFDTLFMKFVVRLLQCLTDFVTLRDASSHLLLHQALSPDKGRKFTPDHPVADLMFLNVMPMATSTSDSGPIIINLSNYVVASSVRLNGKSLDYYGLHRYISSWAKLLEHFHSLTGRKLLLVAHTFRPGKGDDGYWLNHLHEKCSSELPIRHVEGPLAPFEIQKIVAKSSFVIASRMHLALTAINCGVPFLSLGYSHKYQQLIPSSLFGISPVIFLNEHHERLFTAIEEHFDRLWHDRQAYRNALKSYALKARALAEENINFLRMLAKSSGKPGKL